MSMNGPAFHLGRERVAEPLQMTSITPRLADSPISPNIAPKPNTEKSMQVAFTSLLREVGREGYVSIETESNETESTEVDHEKEIVSTWEQWFDEVSNTRYTFVAGSGSPSVRENKTALDLKHDYRQLLTQAYQQGGYVSPIKFLQSLSREELATIQQVQHLADPIQVNQLSDEAALNLLLPPDTQVDSDGNGLTSVGAAQTIRFPDSRTPAKVIEAWEEATASMPESDRLTYVLQIAGINLQSDEQSNYSTNSNSVAAFSEKATRWLDYLEYFKAQIPHEQYQRDQNFWSTFRDALGQANNSD